MVGSFFKSGLADPPMNPPTVSPAPDLAASTNERADPWDGIFRKPLATAAGGGLFFPDPLPPVHVHEILGLHDAEDGGIFRCVDCGHEIWDGVCSSCARVYPGHHRPGIPWSDEDDDDDDSDRGGWMDGMLFGNGPWQVGLDTDSDDDGGDGDEDEDEDGGDEEVADEGPGDGARNAFIGWLEQHMHPGQQDEADEDEESGADDDGYESSFIDDEGAEDVGGAAPSIHELLAVRPLGLLDRAGENCEQDESGADDREDEEDVDYVPSASLRRNRLIVNSDEEENGVNEDDAGYSDRCVRFFIPQSTAYSAFIRTAGSRMQLLPENGISTAMMAPFHAWTFEARRRSTSILTQARTSRLTPRTTITTTERVRWTKTSMVLRGATVGMAKAMTAMGIVMVRVFITTGTQAVTSMNTATLCGEPRTERMMVRLVLQQEHQYVVYATCTVNAYFR